MHQAMGSLIQAPISTIALTWGHCGVHPCKHCRGGESKDLLTLHPQFWWPWNKSGYSVPVPCFPDYCHDFTDGSWHSAWVSPLMLQVSTSWWASGTSHWDQKLKKHNPEWWSVVGQKTGGEGREREIRQECLQIRGRYKNGSIQLQLILVEDKRSSRGPKVHHGELSREELFYSRDYWHAGVAERYHGVSIHSWMLWAADLISGQEGFIWTAWTVGTCNCWCVGIWAEALLTHLIWLLLISNRNAALNENAKCCKLSGLRTTSCLWEQRRHFNQKKMHILKVLLLSPEVFISAVVLLIV